MALHPPPPEVGAYHGADELALQKRFLDKFLKDADDTLGDLPRVRLEISPPQRPHQRPSRPPRPATRTTALSSTSSLREVFQDPAISIVPYALLVPRVVVIPVEDAEVLNQAPCTAEEPVAGASRAEYPLGVLMVVLVRQPGKEYLAAAGFDAGEGRAGGGRAGASRDR